LKQLNLDVALGIENAILVQLVGNIKEQMYDNPYHNWSHVVDVTQSVYCMGLRSGFFENLEKTEIFCLIVAALCHDLEHPV
jgi:hypothetical protein